MPTSYLQKGEQFSAEFALLGENSDVKTRYWSLLSRFAGFNAFLSPYFILKRNRCHYRNDDGTNLSGCGGGRAAIRGRANCAAPLRT